MAPPYASSHTNNERNSSLVRGRTAREASIERRRTLESEEDDENVVSFEPFAVETSIKRHIDDMDDSSYDGPVDLDAIYQVRG